MPPAKPKPEQLLDLLIEKGPALREAGFLTVDLGVVKFNLAPAKEELVEVPLPTSNSESSMKAFVDALDDPETFPGNAEGTPGYYQGRRQGPISNDGALPLDG